MMDMQAPKTPDPVPATSREHSEAAAEGADGQDLTEVRMHSQEPAEGPDSNP